MSIVTVPKTTNEKQLLSDGLKRQDIKDITLFDFMMLDKKGKPMTAFSASDSELRDNNIVVEKMERGNTQTDRTYISGIALLESEVIKYSSKLSYLLHLLLTTKGKVIIYHNDVSGTGILTIKEMLVYNGFLTEDGK